MSRDVLGALKALALPTAALAVVAAFAPGRFELALRSYALVVAAAVVVVVLLGLRRAFPPQTHLELTGVRPRPAERPPSLARVENDVLLGLASSVDLHYRLLPRLRRVASGLLGSRRSVSFATQPLRARAALGDETWELVRPDRPVPQDRLAPGIAARELDSVLRGLERL